MVVLFYQGSHEKLGEIMLLSTSRVSAALLNAGFRAGHRFGEGGRTGFKLFQRGSAVHISCLTVRNETETDRLEMLIAYRDVCVAKGWNAIVHTETSVPHVIVEFKEK
jgi:hypothetical protein